MSARTYHALPWWRDEILLLLAVLAIASFAWYLPGYGGTNLNVDAFWLVQVALDVMFCALSWRVAGVAGPGAIRRFWRLITIGGSLFLLGDAIQSILAVRHPTLANTDAGVIQGLLVAAGAGTCVVAMLTHPMKIVGKERLRFALDAATVMAAAAVVIWYFVIQDAVTGARLGSQLVSAGLMLVSTFALVKLLLGGNAPFTRQAGIVGGVSTALNGIAAAVGPAVVHSSHPNLGLALRLLPCIVLVATPRIQELQVRADPAMLGRRRRRPYSLLPYAAVGVGQVMLVLAAFDGALDLRAWGVIGGVVLITSLVVMRQLDAFADNNRLLQRLDLSMLTLQRQEKRFRSLVQHASDITAVIDAQGLVAYLSPAAGPILGLDPEQAHGKAVHAVVHPDDHATLDRTLADLVAAPELSRACELRMRRSDGTWRWLGVIATNQLDDPSVEGIVCNARDMTEVLEFQNRLRHEATHDPLTGLANRALFSERIRTASLGPADTASVVVIDLDDFKIVNDTLGHHAGDDLLTAVAYRLSGCARTGDTVARLGGDEFALLLPGASADNAVKVAERVLAAFVEPAVSDGIPITIKASVGVATGAMSDTEAILRAADEAMYSAKHGGKNAFASTTV